MKERNKNTSWKDVSESWKRKKEKNRNQEESLPRHT